MSGGGLTRRDHSSIKRTERRERREEEIQVKREEGLIREEETRRGKEEAALPSIFINIIKLVLFSVFCNNIFNILSSFKIFFCAFSCETYVISR